MLNCLCRGMRTQRGTRRQFLKRLNRYSERRKESLHELSSHWSFLSLVCCRIHVVKAGLLSKIMIRQRQQGKIGEKTQIPGAKVCLHFLLWDLSPSSSKGTDCKTWHTAVSIFFLVSQSQHWWFAGVVPLKLIDIDMIDVDLEWQDAHSWCEQCARVRVSVCVCVGGVMHRQDCLPLFVVSTLKEDCEGPKVCTSV